MGRPFAPGFRALLLAFSALQPVAAAEEPLAGGCLAPRSVCRLVEVWWDIVEDRPFESVGVDISIGEAPPPGMGLLITPLEPNPRCEGPPPPGNPPPTARPPP